MKRSKSLKPKATVVWDEQNLEFWEANKSPTQKIDEPKTPYHPLEAEDNVVTNTALENAVHADAIRQALCEVAAASSSANEDGDEGCSSSTGGRERRRYTSYERAAKSMDIDQPPARPRRRRSFEEKRHMHHMEYQKAKSVLNRVNSMIEEEDGGDADAYQDKYMASGSCSQGGCSSSRNENQEANLSRGFGNINIDDGT